MRGYAARFPAQGLGRRSATAWPELTRADLDASIYRQTWASESQRASRFEILVLALDDAHAREVGAARIERQYGAGVLGDLRLLSNERSPYWDAENIATLMQSETPEARQERQDRFRAREVRA